MLHINVALPSGRSENLSVLQSSKVGDLRVLAQKSFEQGFLKLVTSEGHVLNDPTESLQTAGLQDGDHITAISLQARLAATASAFALWCCGCDKIVTWGSAYHGGDSSRVQEKLKGVQQVQTTWNAFAAILSDGSVVTWGDPQCGGDNSAVEHQLKGVQQVRATAYAFSAILADGSVVAWGDRADGGDCSAVQHQLQNVQRLQATNSAFAAILADGSVVTWGDPKLVVSTLQSRIG